MEYYSAIKNNEIMSFVTMWMDLESIMLSELSQTASQIVCVIKYTKSKK